MGYLIEEMKEMAELFIEKKHHVEVALLELAEEERQDYLEEYFEELFATNNSQVASAQMVVENILFELAKQNLETLEEEREEWLEELDIFCQSHNIPKVHRHKKKQANFNGISSPCSKAEKVQALGDPSADKYYAI